MEIAKCLDDGVFYNAVDFSRLLPADLDWKRRLLHCPECGGPAFFRHQSHNGRAPCFGARPHKAGCVLAAFDCERPDYGSNDVDDNLFATGGKIIVEFDYGSSEPKEFDEYIEPAPFLGCDSRNRGNGYRPDALTHRRLSSLLRGLIKYPEFRNSVKPIEIHNGIVTTVQDFFVPLLDVNLQYFRQLKGFYGMLSDVRLSEVNQSVWFNSGGLDTISFRLDYKFLDEFNRRYRFRDKEDFAGANILVIGTLLRAPNKELYCDIEDLGFLALKFT